MSVPPPRALLSGNDIGQLDLKVMDFVLGSSGRWDYIDVIVSHW